MRHGMILLHNKGEDAAEARNFAADWLSDRQDESCSCVSSWVIGGGWSGELSRLLAQFHEAVAKVIPVNEDSRFLPEELGRQTEALQRLWENLGGKETNPLGRDRYDGAYADDVCPLTDCLSVVQRWIDRRPAAVEVWKRSLTEELARNPENKHRIGFYYWLLGMFMLEKFIPEARVFNVSDDDYSMPSDPTGWWAVMCDIHG